jgi:hypothetical protein
VSYTLQAVLISRLGRSRSEAHPAGKRSEGSLALQFYMRAREHNPWPKRHSSSGANPDSVSIHGNERMIITLAHIGLWAFGIPCCDMPPPTTSLRLSVRVAILCPQEVLGVPPSVGASTDSIRQHGRGMSSSEDRMLFLNYIPSR